MSNPASALTIRAVSPFEPEAEGLLKASQKLMSSLYPVCSNHMASAEELASEDAVFLGAFAGGQLLGIGGAVIKSEPEIFAELKSIFVAPEGREQGIGTQLLEKIEAAIRDKNIQQIYLETGIKQEAAIALYENSGYIHCAPFGFYEDDPLSIFMQKRLA